LSISPIFISKEGVQISFYGIGQLDRAFHLANVYYNYRK